jgi:hypothetical protein
MQRWSCCSKTRHCPSILADGSCHRHCQE